MANIKVRDIYVTTEVEQILQILRADLAALGIARFDKIKRRGTNTSTQCPFHANGQERHASFGISDEGECHCFACGWSSSSLDVFISEVFGYQDGGDFGYEWLCRQLGISNSRSIHVNMRSPHTLDLPTPTIVSEEELDSYRYIHPYMYTRKLTDEIIERFDIGYDRSRNCITFPIKDLSGNVVFVATRSVSGKFFTLPEYQNKPIYLANLFTTGKYRKAVVCESFLNALTCWKWGIPAMALIGTGSKHQMSILQKLPVRHYVLALDPDEAGQKGIDRIRRSLKGKILSRYIMPDDHSDLNDLDENILHLKEVLI